MRAGLTLPLSSLDTFTFSHSFLFESLLQNKIDLSQKGQVVKLIHDRQQVDQFLALLSLLG